LRLEEKNMTTVFFEPSFSDEVRRSRLYEGDLIVLSPRPVTLEYCAFARDLIKQAFAPLDPETAQHEMPVEQFAAVLQKLKPAFIHHPESKRYIRGILEACGCDTEKTYYEVPKLRSSTSHGYLTTGIAYAWHPHRDTWTAALPCQINWWVPIYDLQPNNAMSFFPKYWSESIKNSSRGYNYYKWNKEHRGSHVSQYLKHDPRPLPRPTEPLDLTTDVRLIPPSGGIILFSGSHLHASVENTSGVTRFSFDFRTVHLDDIANRRGAPQIDTDCEGHMLRDYIRPTDLAHVPEQYMALYDDGSEGSGDLVFKPS
jgi:hypothetical protein